MTLRLLLVIVLLLTLPGWAALALSGLWRWWKGLQRWAVAVGLSIAIIPSLFYLQRTLFPFMTLGPYKMSGLLVVCAGLTIWRLYPHQRDLLTLGRLEWLALAVLGATLFTRYWIIRGHPYPAWSDSLHHALLTQLTAAQGRLPTSLAPYFPTRLDEYHLGLYSLSATIQWLARVPAHTALLWTVQTLNGLCGMGVYLVLDRKVGRVGAVVGAVVVGLVSYHPAFYVNWGRFTQLAGQTLMPIAWLLTWEAVRGWRRGRGRAWMAWSALFAAISSGALFFLHFRVLGFYLPLLALSLMWELGRARRERRVGATLASIALIGALSLLLIGPALWRAGQAHLTLLEQVAAAPPEDAGGVTKGYYTFPLSTVPYLAGPTSLLVVAGLAALFGLVRRNRLVQGVLLWVLALLLMGYAYLLNVPLLNLTNLGAIMIMLYLPIGLVVGAAAEEAAGLAPPRWRERSARLILGLALAAGFVGSHACVMRIEEYRYFVTPEDVQAMEWIRQNTPSDALFAINTHFWHPTGLHGTDGGYWIPYFTGRRTTTESMLFPLGDWNHARQVIELSRLVERLEEDPGVLPDLREQGVEYIYIGQRGNFDGPGLNANRLSQAEGVTLVYQHGSVSILQITQ